MTDTVWSSYKPEMIITTVITIRTLRCEPGDTTENVTGKLTSRPASKIFGLFQLVESFNKIPKNLIGRPCVHVHKRTLNLAISLSSCVGTSKKLTGKLMQMHTE